MTCRQLRPYIVDFARGASDAIAVEPQISRHLRGCLDCRALLERERILSAALRRAAGDVLVPAATVERERALLAQFDRVSGPDHGGLRLARWRWAPAFAALLLLAGITGWRIVRVIPSIAVAPAEPRAARVGAPAASRPSVAPAQPAVADRDSGHDRGRRFPARRPRAVFLAAAEPPTDAPYLDAAAFLPWPGADAGPSLESGSVIRTRLPVAILPALGLRPPPSAGTEVSVDMLVGQDGFARAVRLAAE